MLVISDQQTSNDTTLNTGKVRMEDINGRISGCRLGYRLTSMQGLGGD
jgi:hypothetical protein